MEDQIKDYEEEKRSIRSKTAGQRKNYDLDEFDDAQLYEEEKRSIRSKTAGQRKNYDLDEFDDAQLERYGRNVELSDVVQVGSRIIIGGGVGLLVGVATIALSASLAEVVIAGVIAKVTGVIGGALGLTMGLNKYQKARKEKEDREIVL